MPLPRKITNIQILPFRQENGCKLNDQKDVEKQSNYVKSLKNKIYSID